MKKLLLLGLLSITQHLWSQHRLSGQILDQSTQKALHGVLINLKNNNQSTQTTEDGYFNLEIPLSEKDSLPNHDEVYVLQIACKGYQSLEVEYPINKINFKIYLEKKSKESTSPKESIHNIEEVVVSTGYQKIHKERATGSFSVVDKKLLDKQVSVNILDKLETAANAIAIDKGTGESGQMMIRGLSTIKGLRSPLIILDNFPYEGNINNINPNMVENITILKDAAAASIWGARAANGVIVITTKKSKPSQKLNIDFSTSLSLSDKPNLNKTAQMSSSDFIDVEQELFNQGFYDGDINSPQHPVLSPVVDLLNKAKLGIISQESAQKQINQLRHVDVRDQYKKYMYRSLENRQYAISISAGTPILSWLSSAAYDDNSGNLDEKYQRFNLHLQNTWKPHSKLSLNTSLFFNQNKNQSGRSPYGSIIVANNGLPYLRFADDQGNPLSAPKQFNQDFKNSFENGTLLDWNYYPLTDWQHNTSKAKGTEILLATSLNYNIIKGLDVDLKYQYQYQSNLTDHLADEHSYYARNYINLFSSIDDNGVVTNNVPKGGILNKSSSFATVNNLRAQLNFSRNLGRHDVSALIGAETKTTNTQYHNQVFYGYNTNNMSFGSVNYTQAYPWLTGGYGYIDNSNSLAEQQYNFISAFANASYTFDKKYSISGSARQDASNLFGLATNDQWNPFWSAGLAWNISNESFYPSKLELNALPQLKLRASIGYNGNIDPSMVAMTTISYLSSNSPFTGQPMAVFSNYYNPKLRWESVKIWNLGLDFSAFNNRINGTLEFFQKTSDNLFGTAPMDYTTGITDLIWNVAGMKGRGLDLQLTTLNMTGNYKNDDNNALKTNKNFRWSTLLNLSTYKDEITQYHLSNSFGRQFVNANVPISGVVGLPVYSIFAYRFAGLEHETGDPLGYLNGEISKDYNKITGTGTDVKDLEYFGSALPTVYGNFTNSFSYRQFSLDIGISYKLGYWFRRPSINYTKLFTEWQDHSDYAKRWQKPGDEAFTNIPSNTFTTNANRDAFFAGSSALIEKGDHVRLQYINLAYRLAPNIVEKTAFKSLELFVNINNIGILWQASKTNIDPDYNLGRYNLRTPCVYTLGLKANF